MKRIGNIWSNVIDENKAIGAIIDGTKYKRGKREVRKLLYGIETVKAHPELYHQIDPQKAREYARYLIQMLSDGTWEHKKPKCRSQFCQNRAHNGGKWRTLYIPCLEDHIISHMVMQASMDAFTRGMHPHSCGSVPGRGINHVAKTVNRWLRTDKQCRYFVKLDIRHFFDSIDGDMLKDAIRKRIKDEKVLNVFWQIIDSADVACPVGYYTSPWFANLLLQDFDWYVEQNLYKERRGNRIKYVRHYLRYVDDILLIGTSKKDLQKSIRLIQEYLSEHYGLSIKPQWEIKAIGKHEIVNGEWKMKPGTYWCDIGGYKFCKDSMIMRDGIYLSARRLSRRMNKKGYYTLHDCQSINSKIGWASHCNSKNFIKNDIAPYINIKQTREVISVCGRKPKTATM